MFWFITEKHLNKQLVSIAFDNTRLEKRIEFLSEKIDFLEDKINLITNYKTMWCKKKPKPKK